MDTAAFLHGHHANEYGAHGIMQNVCDPMELYEK